MCTHFKRLLYAPARKKPYGIVTLGSDRYRNIRNMCHPLPDTTGSYLADAPLGVHLFHARLGSPHLSSSAGAYDLLCSPKKLDRKSTRLNSSHVAISYAVFCLKKKTNITLL